MYIFLASSKQNIVGRRIAFKSILVDDQFPSAIVYIRRRIVIKSILEDNYFPNAIVGRWIVFISILEDNYFPNAIVGRWIALKSILQDGKFQSAIVFIRRRLVSKRNSLKRIAFKSILENDKFPNTTGNSSATILVTGSFHMLFYATENFQGYLMRRKVSKCNSMRRKVSRSNFMRRTVSKDNA